MRDFASQNLVNTAWAFATVGHKKERLFTAMAAAAERRMRDFNSQDLVNTAWASATVGHKEERLFTALAAAAEQRMKDFHSQDLANTAWAFATVGHKEGRLFTALAAVPPFSSVWVTSPCSKSAPPFLFGHIFYTFFKIGFLRFWTSIWEAFGFQIWIWLGIFPYHFLASF